MVRQQWVLFIVEIRPNRKRNLHRLRRRLRLLIIGRSNRLRLVSLSPCRIRNLLVLLLNRIDLFRLPRGIIR